MFQVLCPTTGNQQQREQEKYDFHFCSAGDSVMPYYIKPVFATSSLLKRNFKFIPNTQL